MTPKDERYLRERVRAERKNAAAAKDKKIASLHRTLADNYERRLRGGSNGLVTVEDK